MMTTPINPTNATISIPLTLTAHELAARYSQQQVNPRRAKQVYLNTLAIHAVKTYLGWLEISTDWEAADSANPILQSICNSADLVIEGRGKVECRPVLPDETTCSIPADTWGDRLAYIAIQLNQDLTKGTLLGYLPQVERAQIPLTAFEPLDNLLEQLYGDFAKPSNPEPDRPVVLTQWLQDVFESGWQTVAELFSNPEPELAWNFRGSSYASVPAKDRSKTELTRGKHLRLEPNQDPVGLFIGIHPIADEEFDISVELCPMGTQRHLPKDLQLSILDDEDLVVMQAFSRETKSIQLDFSAEFGDRFSVQVALGEISVTELFMI